MSYIVPIHQASSIRHALKLQFMKPEEESLIVALVEPPGPRFMRHSLSVSRREI